MRSQSSTNSPSRAQRMRASSCAAAPAGSTSWAASQKARSICISPE